MELVVRVRGIDLAENVLVNAVLRYRLHLGFAVQLDLKGKDVFAGLLGQLTEKRYALTPSFFSSATSSL